MRTELTREALKGLMVDMGNVNVYEFVGLWSPEESLVDKITAAHYAMQEWFETRQEFVNYFRNWKSRRTDVYWRLIGAWYQDLSTDFAIDLDKMYCTSETDDFSCTDHLVWNCHVFSDPIQEKNFYHHMLKQYGADAFPLMRKKTLMGHAYVEAVKRVSSKEELNTPPANLVFRILRQKLERLEKYGYRFSDKAKASIAPKD